MSKWGSSGDHGDHTRRGSINIWVGRDIKVAVPKEGDAREVSGSSMILGENARTGSSQVGLEPSERNTELGHAG